MLTTAKAVVILLVVFMVATLFIPTVRQGLARVFVNSETVVIPSAVQTGVEEEQEIRIVTLLGFDAIPAILTPRFADVAEADGWMEPDEPVLGLSINGDNRAYSVRMLSRHEIVNDVVGGKPVAVTW